MIGGVYGAAMYFPLIFFPTWLLVEVNRLSIVYEAKLVFDGYISREWVRIIYAAIVLVPLLLCSNRNIKIFGFIIAVSVLVARVFFNYAFISIWCYFAAVLSCYIFFLLWQEGRTAHQISSDDSPTATR